MTGVYALIAALVVATVAGLVWRRRSGRVRAVAPDGERLGADDIGVPLGERATLVQFSTTFCQPCRATRRVLADVAGTIDGVTHVDIDAGSHLELVRRLGVVRAPTVLVLDRDGRVVRRATGQPRRSDVVAAVGEAVGT